MLQLLFFLAIGGVLLIFLVALSRRGKAEGAAEVLVDAHQALITLRTELLPQGFVERLFAREDLEFVNSEGVAEISHFFDRERKKIALAWVKSVQRQVALLKQLHLGSARFYARLEFKTEASLAWNFMILSVTCKTLQLTFRTGGAFAAPRVVGTVATAASRVCEISAQSLEFLGRAGLDGTSSTSPSGPPALGI
jgi:hypothetical protein